MSTVDSTPTIAPAGTTWAADPVHSNVAFEVEYAGVSIFRGSFRDFDATLEGSALEGSARVASVDVKDEQLSGHLQSPDFFDAERHPEISFRADELTLADGGAVAGSGSLTIKGVTKPVELQGRLAAAPSVDPFGRERLGLSLETALDGVELELWEGIGELPFYDEDLETDAPDSVRRLREDWAAADAILFSTPEYNGSVPGGLKNAIDWASRPRLEAVLRNKPVAVVGASTGQFGALWAQQDLKRILGIAGARVVGTEIPVSRAHERFDSEGRLLDGEVFEQLRLHLTTLASEAVP